MSYKKILLGICSLVLLIAPLSQARAATSFDSISFKPASDWGYYLTVDQSQTLGQWGWAAGMLVQLTNDSVISYNSANSKINDVVNYELITQLAGSLGVLDWLNVGLLVNIVPYQQFDVPVTGTEDNGFRMGDIQLNLKGRILDLEKYPVGLALVPFVTFPTGDDDHYIGNGKVTGGAKLVVESPRFWNKVSAALNVGAQIRKSATLAPMTTIDDQLLMGVAVNYAPIEKLHLIAEMNGWTPFENFFDGTMRDLEAHGAARYFPIEKLAVTVGGGSSISEAVGSPDWRVFASVAYVHPKEEQVIVEQVIRTNKVHFEFDKARILPESYPILDEIVETLRNPRVMSCQIEGHTDSKGTDEYNQRLSERRAASVRQYLINKGIPASKLTSVGKGESTPIAPNEINGKDNPQGRALNRRVEFHLQLSSTKHLKVIEKDTAPTFVETGASQ